MVGTCGVGRQAQPVVTSATHRVSVRSAVSAALSTTTIFSISIGQGKIKEPGKYLGRISPFKPWESKYCLGGQSKHSKDYYTKITGMETNCFGTALRSWL